MARLLDDQRVRFVLVGGANTVVGYALFVLLQWIAGRYISYFGSVVIAHLLSSLLAFWLYRRWVFRVGKGGLVLDFLRFQTVFLIPLAANLIALPFLVTGLKVNVYLAQAAIVVVSVVISFIGHKYFSFRRPQQVIRSVLTQGEPGYESD